MLAAVSGSNNRPGQLTAKPQGPKHLAYIIIILAILKFCLYKNLHSLPRYLLLLAAISFCKYCLDPSHDFLIWGDIRAISLISLVRELGLSLASLSQASCLQMASVYLFVIIY